MTQAPDLSGSTLLLPMYYFPCLEYFVLFLQAQEVMIETHEHFQKQSYRNRCYVLTANGVETLTVPIQHPTGKVPIRDIRIDNTQRWQKKHWRCLTSAYAKSPFFEFYAPDFFTILNSATPFLFDLNERLLTLCLKFLGIKTTFRHSLSYEVNPNYPVFDARSCITDKNNVNRYMFYSPRPYYQTFGNDFSGNLSIIDLLFNMGPEALEVLKKSANLYPQSGERTDKNIGLI
jgi:hypothetical protein